MTFAKMFCSDQAKFGLSCGGEGGKKILMWRRFKYVETSDYYCMEESNFDSMTISPRTNIVWHGFGLNGNYEKIDMDYKVCW